MIGLDFFDASINRIAAWVNRHAQYAKRLLNALLQPIDKLKELQDQESPDRGYDAAGGEHAI